jgi:hypothetical protein
MLIGADLQAPLWQVFQENRLPYSTQPTQSKYSWAIGSDCSPLACHLHIESSSITVDAVEVRKDAGNQGWFFA